MTQPDRHFDNIDPRATTPPSGLFSPARRTCYLLIVLGAVGCLFGWLMNPVQFHFSYLASWGFVWTVLMGMLFFVMLHHLADAGWSTVVRRPAEAFLAAMPVLALLFIPVLVGTLSGKTHNWVNARVQMVTAFTPGSQISNPQSQVSDSSPAPPSPPKSTIENQKSGTEGVGRGEHDAELLAKKRHYLNVPFFLARQIVYFAVWLLLAWKLRRNSLAQDAAGEARYTRSNRRLSSVGMLLYALTFSFASFDWFMSLDWRWFSTIFGVYTWSGAVCSSLAALAMLSIALSSDGGPLRQYIGSDTRHDLGKLLFAFCVFWAYIAFSQWFLVWYGNIPEETVWYLKRWTGEAAPLHSKWWIVTTLLPLGRFVVPFFVIMSAHTKRNPRTLGAISALTLVFAWLDVYWLVMPAKTLAGPPVAWLWLDASSLALVIGCCGVVALKALRTSPLYPMMDPRLVEALSAEHVEEIGACDVE